MRFIFRILWKPIFSVYERFKIFLVCIFCLFKDKVPKIKMRKNKNVSSSKVGFYDNIIATQQYNNLIHNINSLRHNHWQSANFNLMQIFFQFWIVPPIAISNFLKNEISTQNSKMKNVAKTKNNWSIKTMFFASNLHFFDESFIGS